MNEATLQTIFILGFAAYAAQHTLPYYLYRAAWRIMNCRTPALGGHVQACPEGHFQRNHYNSCKHRACPLCAYIQVQRWLQQQAARLLPCDHYHVIFTIPHELNPLWTYNRATITEILFQSAKATLFQLLQDPKYLGAKPGVIASLHTWTKTLQLHPHIHCLVTGGGFKDGAWVPLPYDYLFPIAIARILFRAKVLEAIRQALENGRLVLPPSLSAPELLKLLSQLRRKKWNLRIQEKYTHGKGILTYLARYLRGGPIANSRIVKVDTQSVTFHIGRGKKQLLTLPLAEFIARFLQHVPLPSSVVVRSWGLYATSKRKELEQCHNLLGGKLEQVAAGTWQELLEQTFGEDAQKDTPWKCPVCGKRLVRRIIIPPVRPTPGHSPPALRKEPCSVT